MPAAGDNLQVGGTGNNRPIIARLSAAYPSLSRTQRRIADFILGSDGAGWGLTITELSGASGASQATIVRFCRAIGFAGYTDFKLALAAEFAPRLRALPDEHSDVQVDDSLETLLTKVLSTDSQAIANTLATLDLEAFARAVEVLSGARTVELVGVGSSLPVATDGYYRLMRAGVHCHICMDSHVQAMTSALLGNGDALLAVSYSGETGDVLDCVELAKQGGATSLCITNSPGSRLARAVDICLVTASAKTRWLDDSVAARVAQLAVFDALCVALIRRAEAEAIPVLERLDRAVERKWRRT